jgi:Flp pilus assembly protein TadG
MVTRLKAIRRDHESAGGFTLVEFALASVIFLMITIGTIDVGRSIYLYSQLHNAVRDAAREAKVGTANGYGFSNGTISHRVNYSKNLIDGDEHDRLGLTNVTVTYSCNGSCSTGDSLTITASMPFSAVMQSFLSVDPFTLTASSTVTLE